MHDPKEDILPKMIPTYKEAFAACDFSVLQEIRLRVLRPVILHGGMGRMFCASYGASNNRKDAIIPQPADMAKQLFAFCRGSAYAYQDDLGNGFLTLRGGHRVGVSGKAVKKGSAVISMQDVSGLNVRIAREFIGCADGAMPCITDRKRIFSTLLISPPGVGKTTMLRDITRQLSADFKVTVVDERGEIAAMEQGVPSFDIGEQTDVLDGFPKDEGITCALRALSPDVIITDEIGTEADKTAIREILKGGCKIVTSMHGYSIEEAMEKKADLLSLFERLIFLEKTEHGAEVKQWLKC